ncbi:MAG: hypothetical protein GEU71_00755 [Actinobacteria bacterium]|nr:hypothetical protein [Actinomycetota bacterium]
MPILPNVRYEDMTWPDLKKAAEQDAVIVQPVGAIEQHGPHLPVSTDTMQVNNATFLACAEAAEQIPVLLAPTVHWGFSTIQMDIPNEDKDRYPGTLTLTAQLLMDLCVQLSQCFVRAGFKRILFVNGHGGNYQPLMTVARTIRDLTDAMVGVANYYGLVEVKDMLDVPLEEASIKHAGEWETSLALLWDADNVRMDQIKSEQRAINAIKVNSEYVSRDELGGKQYSTKAFVAEKNIDFSFEGVVGNPAQGSAEKGQKFADLHVASIVEFLLEFKKWEYGKL